MASRWSVVWVMVVTIGSVALAQDAKAPGTGHEDTVVTPTLDSPMVAGKNMVWCATFQMAWDELRTLASGTAKG